MYEFFVIGFVKRIMLTCLKIGTTDFSTADNASFCVELLILKSTCGSTIVVGKRRAN